MATWLTVYCTKKLAIPSAEVLQTKVLELRERLPEVVADWELSESSVLEALEHLRVVAVSPRGLDFEVHYGAPHERPLVLHYWAEAERVKEEIEEALESRAPPPEVLEHIHRCAEVLAIEMGFSQLEDMGLVLAHEIADFFARLGVGVICDDDDNWWWFDDELAES